MGNDHISAGGQIKIYVGKCFRLFSSEKQWKNFLSTLIIMAIISLVTSSDMFLGYKDTKNGAFAIICACIWIGLFNSIQSICRERAIIKREYRTGLRISSYVLAHVVYEFILSAGEALIVLVIVALKNLTHLPDDGLILGKIPDLYISFLLVVFSSDMLALLISSIVKNENTAMTVMPFVLIIQLVMSGAVFELSDATELISHLTVSKWGLNAICSIANTNRTVSAEYSFADGTGCTASASNLAGIWLLLLVFAAIYILLAIIALRRVDKDER